MIDNIQVISFDLDGVLFDGGSAAYPLAHQLGIGDKFLEVYKKVGAQKKGLVDSIREGSKIWKGIAVDGSYDNLVTSLPLMKGAEETLETLRSWGYSVGCISSGVSQFFMAPFQKRLKLDFAYSNVLGEENGVHDGTVKYVMGGPQKADTALRYLEEQGLSSESLAAVGDGNNDIDIFRMSAFSIAFNPESPEVSAAASATVTSKDLRLILEYFEKT